MSKVSKETMEALKRLDTCTVSNAIEHFEVRLRNEGFMNSSVRCMFPGFSPCAGYAVTGRIRTSSTPVNGECYYNRTDWWEHVLSAPAPRFIVLKDSDHTPGCGAFIGEIHANIFAALECTAVVTNGALRDLPGVKASGVQIFAANLAVSHAYAHISEFGEPVEVAGLLVKPGDLLHGDRHGVHSIPISIADRIPEVAKTITRSEQRLIDFCRSKEFSAERLPQAIRQLGEDLKLPDCKLK